MAFGPTKSRGSIASMPSLKSGAKFYSGPNRYFCIPVNAFQTIICCYFLQIYLKTLVFPEKSAKSVFHIIHAASLQCNTE